MSSTITQTQVCWLSKALSGKAGVFSAFCLEFSRLKSRCELEYDNYTYGQNFPFNTSVAEIALSYFGNLRQAAYRPEDVVKALIAVDDDFCLGIANKLKEEIASSSAQPAYAPQPQPAYAPQPQPAYAPQPQPAYAPQPQPVSTNSDMLSPRERASLAKKLSSFAHSWERFSMQIIMITNDGSLSATNFSANRRFPSVEMKILGYLDTLAERNINRNQIIKALNEAGLVTIASEFAR